MKIKTKTEKVISLQDWDELIKKTYGKPYAFQQQDGCKSRGFWRFQVPSDDPYDFTKDTVPEVVNGEEMGVSFKAWLERDAKKPIKDQDADYELELWWHRNFYPSFDIIADDLYTKGLINKGNYIIEIDW